MYPHILKIPFSTVTFLNFNSMLFLLFFPLSLLLGRFFFFFSSFLADLFCYIFSFTLGLFSFSSSSSLRFLHVFVCVCVFFNGTLSVLLLLLLLLSSLCSFSLFLLLISFFSSFLFSSSSSSSSSTSSTSILAFRGRNGTWFSLSLYLHVNSVFLNSVLPLSVVVSVGHSLLSVALRTSCPLLADCFHFCHCLAFPSLAPFSSVSRSSSRGPSHRPQPVFVPFSQSDHSLLRPPLSGLLSVHHHLHFFFIVVLSSDAFVVCHHMLFSFVICPTIRLVVRLSLCISVGLAAAHSLI